MAYKVYMWTDKTNGKKYIGTTSKAMEKRAGEEGEQYRGATRFYAAICEHGWENFDVEILADGLDRKAAAALETRLIAEYNTTDPEVGYNQQLGGLCRHDVELTDRNKRISDTLKSERSTPAYRAIMRDRMLDVWSNEASRARMLYKRAGKLSGRPAVSVACDSTGTTYRTLHDAARDTGLSVACLSKHLKSSDSFSVTTRNGVVLKFHKSKVHGKESELLEG